MNGKKTDVMVGMCGNENKFMGWEGVGNAKSYSRTPLFLRRYISLQSPDSKKTLTKVDHGINTVFFLVVIRINVIEAAAVRSYNL